VLHTHSLTRALYRDFIRSEMRLLFPQGFDIRDPNTKKVKRKPLLSLGPNDEWSCDGHDKLKAYGFPIWGVRDKWSRKWLGLWVVPDNRLGLVIAYLYLRLVRDKGGKLFVLSILNNLAEN
jgi:hypothetical protein